jgi:hypothetical protein
VSRKLLQACRRPGLLAPVPAQRRRSGKVLQVELVFPTRSSRDICRNSQLFAA